MIRSSCACTDASPSLTACALPRYVSASPCAEVDGLNAELHRLQTSAEADAGVRAGLQKAKADLEGRKAMLELQVSQLQSQVAKDQESSAALVAKITILEQGTARAALRLLRTCRRGRR